MITEDIIILRVYKLCYLDSNEHNQDKRRIVYTRNKERHNEAFSDSEQRISNSMMWSRKVELRNFHEEDVLKLVNELWVLVFIVLFACIVTNDDRPGKSADKTTDAKDRVHCFASIAVARIGQIMELEEAKPNCC